MAREHNFLLGRGERLTDPVDVPKGGGPKNPPYSFAQARQRIGEKLQNTTRALARLPMDACPNGQAVAVLTMHPRYISKTDFPGELLRSVGLQPVGSRARRVVPESWGTERHPDEAITEELFVAGPRSAFAGWAGAIRGWDNTTSGAAELAHIEDIGVVDARLKLKGVPPGRQVLLEVVLHNFGSASIVEAFLGYARRHRAHPLANRQRTIRGLTFLPVRVDSADAEELAGFSFLRVARGMPSLRPFRPNILRAVSGPAVSLPSEGPIDESFRAAIFDGGIPRSARQALAPCVALIEPPGLARAVPEWEEHGLAVTSSFLFGPLSEQVAPPRPVCRVDHVRILDEHDARTSDLECLDALDRILDHLDANPGYQLVNISVGPNMAVDDDDITAWTAALDERLADGACVATVAAGNDGERDEAAGLNRIQPPADAVNVLAVGACDSPRAPWRRAAYSSVGPGRCPGLVKPDGVAFGGSDALLFAALRPNLRIGGYQGTSFAAPMALRSAAAVRAQLGDALSPLAIRGLIIHRAECDDSQDRKQVGWGRFEDDPSRLITCEDDEALVVYQGRLPVGQHLRAFAPVPRVPLVGQVSLSATLVIAPEVDPAHPSAYTRSGLGVAFRPHSGRHTERADGSVSRHPRTIPFFSTNNMYAAAEYDFRKDGNKWEPCLRNTRSFRASSLQQPCFDIYYHHRANGRPDTDLRRIPYALVISIQAPRMPDLYDRIVRAYSNVLIPIRPRVRVQVQV